MMCVQKCIKRAVVYCSVVAGFCVGGLAESVYDLGRIEALAPQDVAKNKTTNVITSDDIATSSSNNVAEAMRYSTGVFYQPSVGSRGEPSIGLRGYGQTHIGLFIDGIPVHSIYDRQTDWAQFSTFGIAEIDVSKGYTSPAYGTNTLGGAVNIITSKPKDRLEIYTRYGFVSDNEHQANVSIGGREEKFYYQLGYAFTDRDSLNLSKSFKPTAYQDSKEMLNSHYKNHTLRGKVGFEPNENHEYSLNLIYQKGEKGGLINANSGGRVWDWPHYDKLMAYLLGRSALSDKLALESRIYYDSFQNELNMLGRLNTNGSISGNPKGISLYDDYTIGGIFVLNYEFDMDKKLKLGTNLRHDNHNATDKPLPGATGTNDNSKIRDLSTSVFAEYAQQMGEVFSFALNGSYDRNDLLHIEGVDSGQKPLQGWTLQGIAYAHLGEVSTLYVNIGKKSRMPTMKDRFSSTWGERVANPNLKVESALNYELGTLFEYESGKASLALFYNDINNMLISVGMPDSSCANGKDCVRLENAKEGYAYGAEVSFEQRAWSDRLRFGANYSYVERKATNTSGSSYGVDGSRILDYPNHIANLTFMLTPISQVDLIALATFQSKQWYVTGGKYAQNNDIFLLDVKANYRIFKGLQASLGAYNLLDKNYYYGSGYYMAGRRVMASVEYRF